MTSAARGRHAEASRPAVEKEQSSKPNTDPEEQDMIGLRRSGGQVRQTGSVADMKGSPASWQGGVVKRQHPRGGLTLGSSSLVLSISSSLRAELARLLFL